MIFFVKVGSATADFFLSNRSLPKLQGIIMGKKLFFLLFLLVSVQLITAQNLPYKNPNLKIEERVKDLLGRMTLEEKIAQMRSISFESFVIKGEFDEQKLVERSKNLSYGCIDGIILSAKTNFRFFLQISEIHG